MYEMKSKFRSSGHKKWNILISNPLIWNPSWSWSVIIIIFPYLSDLTSLYFLLLSNPRIFLILTISVLALICFTFASRTLRTLPFRGNTPYLSLPTSDNPAIAIDFAESPSVRIRVHWSDFFVPAQLASSNFGTIILFFFLPSVFFRSLLSFLELASRILSINSLFEQIFLIYFADSNGLEPNLLCDVIHLSLVCESNEGFSITQLMYREIYLLTTLSLISFLCCFFMKAIIPLHTCLAIHSTWDPPLLVQIPFTNDTCSNVSLCDTEKITSHLSDTISWHFTESL